MGDCFSKKVSPPLLDMPLDVVNLILKNLELKDLLRCRKVCRGLRTAVDEFGIRFDEIKFVMNDNYIKMKFDENVVVYTDEPIGGTTVTYQGQPRQFKRRNFVEFALNGLKIVLKHVSICLIVNHIENRHDIITSFLETLASVGCIYAKKTIIEKLSFEHVISILPYFDAKTLKNILLIETDQVVQFERIIHLDQWKNAQKYGYCCYPSSTKQLEYCFHFEEFPIEIDELSVQNAVQIRDDLMKRSTFQSCQIFFSKSANLIEIAKVFKPDIAGDNYFKFEYSNNNDAFIIECTSQFRFFVKKCNSTI